MIDAIEMHIVTQLERVEDTVYDIQLLSNNSECQTKRIMQALRRCLKKARDLEAEFDVLKSLYISERNQRRFL